MRRATPYLLLAAIWLLFFWRFLIPTADRVTFPDGDFTQQFFIFRSVAYNAVAAGHLPLWASCFFGGYPFHADPQSQLFYPPVWVSFALLRLGGWGSYPLLALTIEAVAHYLMVSLFSFAFFRAELSGRLGARPGHDFAALVGAVVYAYGGYLTGYPPLQTAILETAVWLPLVLLAMRRMASAGNPAAAAWAALALAAALFAGHPQTFLFITYLAAAYFVYRAAAEGKPWRWTLFRLAGVVALAGGLGSVQMVPQAQFLSLSTRASLSFAALSGGFSLADVIQVLVTRIVSRWHPLYIGILPLTLAIVAVAAVPMRRGQGAGARPALFWLIAVLVGLLLSFGANSAGYDLAYWILPGYRLFRGQERAALLVAFPAAALAAFGAALVFAPLSRRTRGLVRAAARSARNLIPLAAFALAAAVLLRTAFPDNGDLRELPGRFALLLFGLVFTALALFARLAPGGLWSRMAWRARGPRAGYLLILGLTAQELFTANARVNQVPPFDPYPHSPILDPIRADPDPFFRVQDDARMQGHFACGYGLAEWGGISPIRPAAWDAFDRLAPEALRWKVMGVKYLITWKNGALTREGDLPPAIQVAEGGAPQGEAKVYRMYEIPRRAWLVYWAEAAASTEALYAALQSPGFDPFASAVVREAAPPLGGGPAGDQGPGVGVEVTADRPGLLTLAVNAEAPALAVVSEAFYPGWTASVNGVPAPVLEADAFLLAVPVPEGQSTVTLAYRPATLIAGAAVSLATLAVLLGLLLYQLRRGP